MGKKTDYKYFKNIVKFEITVLYKPKPNISHQFINS